MGFKRILKKVLFLVIILFAIKGCYHQFIEFQYNTVKKKVENIESKRNYDKDLLYYKDGGEPLILVNKNNKKTVFFMEGFRTQSPAGMYYDFLTNLYYNYNVNVVVPVYGLQSSPFSFRNRDWNFREDMRTVLQIYDAYTSLLPQDHKVVVISQSFGTLPNMTIAAKALRKPNNIIFLSPLNTGMEYKVAGPIVYFLSKQTRYLQYILLFSWITPPPGRVSVWDIVNEEKNLKMAKRNDNNPEDSSRYGYLIEKAAIWMETNLMKQVSNQNILIVYGDSDLYFSEKGFLNFYNILKPYNNVEILKITNSGHMVLLDNGEEILKKRILEILK